MHQNSHPAARSLSAYQHVARGADQVITSAIDTHVEGEKRRDEGGGGGAAGALIPRG
jgi:hypothetical protein